MPELFGDFGKTVSLVVLAVAVLASLVWELLRRRCGRCGRWNALVRIDQRVYHDESVDGRYRCKYCRGSMWREDPPPDRPDQFVDRDAGTWRSTGQARFLLSSGASICRRLSSPNAFR